MATFSKLCAETIFLVQEDSGKGGSAQEGERSRAGQGWVMQGSDLGSRGRWQGCWWGWRERERPDGETTGGMVNGSGAEASLGALRCGGRGRGEGVDIFFVQSARLL